MSLTCPRTVRSVYTEPLLKVVNALNWWLSAFDSKVKVSRSFRSAGIEARVSQNTCLNNRGGR